MIQFLRKEWRVLLILWVSILVFLLEIVLLKKGFLSGDHRLQHYPWFYLYAESVKHFQLPWWTDLYQCGFPLLAEGQIGAFYPLNFIFAFFLPVRFAYNYSVLFHYFLGGIFFYLYVKKIGLNRPAALWAALIFLFGSCQAGFFYNVTSQRVLIWFPLSLYVIHRFLESGSWRNVLHLGVIYALESVAGYQQYAVYAIGFSFLYLGFLDFRKLPWALGSLVFSILLALPQWIPFLELSRFSSRSDLTEAFAYLGSMNPLGFLTVFFPSWQGALGVELYAGILGIFFALCSLWTERNRAVNANLFLLVMALLLALGGLSPLYVALVKITHFYGFRIPVKFLFFAGFSLAVLSGWGIQHALYGISDRTPQSFKKFSSLFSFLAALLISGALLGHLVLAKGRGVILSFLEDFVRRFVAGKPYRTHSLAVYLSKVETLYESVLRVTHPAHPWLLAAFVLLVISALAAAFFSRKSLGQRPQATAILFLILFVDLFLYGFRNVKGDYENFSSVSPSPAIRQRLQQDPAPFRIYIFNPSGIRESVPLVSNANGVDGIPNIGVYSPLAFRNYKTFMGTLGAVDDSLGLEPVSEKAMFEGLDQLRLLNVKYIVSEEKLSHPDLEKMDEEKGYELYQLRNSLSQVLFIKKADYGTSDFQTLIGKAEPIRIARQPLGPSRKIWEIEVPEEGYLLTGETQYPGWLAWLDGSPIEVSTYLSLFRKIEVPKGRHRIEMAFRPRYLPWVMGISLVSLAVYLMLWKHSFYIFWNTLVVFLYVHWVVLNRIGT